MGIKAWARTSAYNANQEKHFKTFTPPKKLHALLRLFEGPRLALATDVLNRIQEPWRHHTGDYLKLGCFFRRPKYHSCGVGRTYHLAAFWVRVLSDEKLKHFINKNNFSNYDRISAGNVNTSKYVYEKNSSINSTAVRRRLSKSCTSPFVIKISTHKPQIVEETLPKISSTKMYIHKYIYSPVVSFSWIFCN